MSQVVIPIPLPLDEAFLRRECPYCYQEFKVEMSHEDIQDLAQRLLESFWLSEDPPYPDQPADEQEEQLFCPYCGQQANKDAWWTQEQLAYVRVFAENLMADSVNKRLDQTKRSLGRIRSGHIAIKMTTQKMKKKEPWIAPEDNSMRVFDLLCCSQRIKVQDEWLKPVFCVFCGFPYNTA